MSMRALMTLGAPALPFGYFYRIGAIGLDGTDAVCIMREGRYFDRRVMCARIRTWDDGKDIPVDTAVLAAAQAAYEAWTTTDRLIYWKGDHK